MKFQIIMSEWKYHVIFLKLGLKSIMDPHTIHVEEN